MSTTYEYGVAVSDLPPQFQSEVKRLNLAQNGIWITNATCSEAAFRQIQEIITIITKEQLNKQIQPERFVKRSKTKTIKQWNLQRQSINE